MNTFHFNFVKRWDPIKNFLRKKHVNMISGKKKYVHKIIKDSLYNFRLIKKHETHYLFFWPHQVLQTLKTQHSLWFFVYSRGSKHTSISWNYHTGNGTQYWPESTGYCQTKALFLLDPWWYQRCRACRKCLV